ncbi:hypothetical protein HYALB_00008232 [Hymenoscyphus albidus]|uniref:Uncharacterized protein n=1 Tax=Hymenoscyphus albidus TaxID=595503 RepID=A0A9N9LNH7_9HELO|nr:hypothetical protein HYALB_00008232 [Hymenoscyphus albidus]
MSSTTTKRPHGSSSRNPNNPPSYKESVEKDLPAVRARAYDMYVTAYPKTKFGNLEELEVHNQEIALEHIEKAYYKHRKQLKKATKEVQVRAFSLYQMRHPYKDHTSILQVQSENYKLADHYINKAYYLLQKELKAEEDRRNAAIEELKAALYAAEERQAKKREEQLLLSAQQTVQSAHVTSEQEERDAKLRERENLWIGIGQQRRLYRHCCFNDRENGGAVEEDTKEMGRRLKGKEKRWREMKRGQVDLVEKYLDWRTQALEEKTGCLARTWFRMRYPLWKYKGQQAPPRKDL